jgi:hypothetical protein
MISLYDIIIIIIVIVIILAIVVINVKNDLNNKLSNIEVKIPEIEIPQQNIIVNVQKKCDSDKYDVFFHKDKEIIQSQKVTISPINNIETFNPNVKAPIEIIPNKNKTENTTVDHVKTPDEGNVVDYNNYICMKKQEYNKLKESDKIKLQNEQTIQSIIKNDNNYHDEDEYDTLEYFIKHRQFIPSSFEDGVTRGGNIGEYDGYGGLDDIGKIKLGKNNYKYPKPNNYLFAREEK